MDLLPPALLLAIHAGATFYMVGLAWFVQRVHYPLLAGVGRERFPPYEAAHVARTTPVVGPPMLVELTTGLALLGTPTVPLGLAAVGLVLLAVIWASTAALQVPRHRELAEGFDARAHRRLVSTSWIRTLAWSLRGLLVGVMLVVAGRSLPS